MTGKREQTRQLILDKALELASAGSLNGLTIGTLAASTGMSKSGLFGHFQSKENLQLAVLEHATARFIEIVVAPSREVADPVERLVQLAGHWLGWYESFAGNCIYISAITEFDDQPGPLRDYVAVQQSRLIGYLARICDEAVAVGRFQPDLKGEQFAFEMYSLYIGSQMFLWLDLETSRRERFHQGFNALLNRSRITPTTC